MCRLPCKSKIHLLLIFYETLFMIKKRSILVDNSSHPLNVDLILKRVLFMLTPISIRLYALHAVEFSKYHSYDLL